jgi:ABC-type multidrug transport system ATPase subunit
VLEASAITVRAGKRTILDGASFTLRRGEILAVIGPNGAGKTTLFEAVLGLVASETKALAFDGEAIASFRDRARVFAYVPDDAVLPEELGVRTIVGGAVTDAELLGRNAGTLSRGEAKRVWLALALAAKRPVLVLDEPFGAFDPVQLEGVLASVRAAAGAGSAVLVSIHQIATAEKIADRVLLLAEGKVVADGTLAEVRGEHASLEAAFRARLSGDDAAP